MNILIVKFGALGDVVRTSYVLSYLHTEYKNNKVGWKVMLNRLLNFFKKLIK